MKYLLILIFIFLFSGCSQKVDVSYLVPAKVDRATQNKKISVMQFKNDDIGVSSKLESLMSNKIINGKPYFTLVSRDEKNKIIEEQKFQYSGLVNNESAVELGELIGAEAIITGELNNASLNYDHFYVKRVKCRGDDCKRKYEYRVRCERGTYNISFNIKMIDVQKGDIIYADSYQHSTAHTHCHDRRGGLPSKQQELDKLSTSLLQGFITSISPSFQSYRVELLDDPEIDYTDKQEDLLEYSLEYIELGQYKKAEQLLSQLLNSTNDKCYVAAYNLGIIKELQGQYKYAQQLFQLADTLVLEPNEQVAKAVVRLEKIMQNQEKLTKQLNSK
jgi:hypothetical protein